ncbi:hypothetical protein ACFPAF_18240 [Hymenobacter endophyticus]|uniref:AAA+ ATPase domain-containing protein n=1 Tax=Hymenobacter endophyticus TaxID=3076335 RepID=A0ABU3TLT2_9BACT|nr:hypothetical protein [Hymenobacter endophyticus]MDU0372347.1 hypothetical protein [Hymenobacter endophyticus]
MDFHTAYFLTIMAHTKNCQSCGTTIIGNINRRFCTDACRKYYKAHGNTGHSGLPDNRLNRTEKSGEKRKSAYSIGDYAAKRLIDFAGKMAESQLISASTEPKPGGIAGLVGQAPLLTATLTGEIRAGRQPGQYRPALPPTLRQFLGELTHPFQMLIWGLPGSGKSTMSMIMANEMAAFRKVLYISGEEGLNSTTLRQKQARTITRHDRFLFANRLPNSKLEWRQILLTGTTGQMSGQLAGNALSPTGQRTGWPTGQPTGGTPEYRTIVYDSITMLGIHPFHVKATANDCQLPAFSQHISHIFISHAHKDGKEYRGDGSWGHEVDIIIRCHEGVATIQKNRFATAEQGRIGTEYKIY